MGEARKSPKRRVTNVQHLARVDDGHALVMTRGSVNLQTIALP
jgi:hypothetical protein